MIQPDGDQWPHIDGIVQERRNSNIQFIDGLVQERRNSIANTNPSAADLKRPTHNSGFLHHYASRYWFLYVLSHKVLHLRSSLSLGKIVHDIGSTVPKYKIEQGL